MWARRRAHAPRNFANRTHSTAVSTLFRMLLYKDILSVRSATVQAVTARSGPGRLVGGCFRQPRTRCWRAPTEPLRAPRAMRCCRTATSWWCEGDGAGSRRFVPRSRPPPSLSLLRSGDGDLLRGGWQVGCDRRRGGEHWRERVRGCDPLRCAALPPCALPVACADHPLSFAAQRARMRRSWSRPARRWLTSWTPSACRRRAGTRRASWAT